VPVILTTEEECEAWSAALWSEACVFQRPSPDGVLKIIASGERENPPPERTEAAHEPLAAALMAEN